MQVEKIIWISTESFKVDFCSQMLVKSGNLTPKTFTIKKTWRLGNKPVVASYLWWNTAHSVKLKDTILIFQQSCELKKGSSRGMGIRTKLFEIYQIEVPLGLFYLAQKADKVRNTDVFIWKSHKARESPGTFFNFRHEKEATAYD